MIAEIVMSDWKWSGLAFLGILFAICMGAAIFHLLVNWPPGADPDNDRCAFCKEPICGTAGATIYKPEGTQRVCAECMKPKETS